MIPRRKEWYHVEIILNLHSLNRWLIIVLAVVVSLLTGWGYFSKRPFSLLDDRLGLIYTILLDIQVLLGLLLMLLGAFHSRSILHAVVMLVAIAVAHIGRSRARRSDDPATKHLMQGLGAFFSLVIIGAGLPFVT